MSGFFKVYREVFQHEIFKDELGFRLFMLIIGNAVYLEKGIDHKDTHLQRGQWIRSYRLLADDLERKEGRGYKKPSLSTIKRAVDRLVKFGLVAISETDNGTLFTVVNYEKYQGFANDDGTDSGTDNGTLAERYRNKTKKDKKERKKDNNRRQYSDDSPYMKMANYLLEKIKGWKPDYVFKGNIQTWADDFRKMHELDKRSKKDIRDIIDWVTSHPFWQANVLSAKKLREKFDTLQGQMRSQSNKVIPLNDRREKARLDVFDMQKAVNKFVNAGFDPDRDQELFQEWLKGGAKLNELSKYAANP